MAISFRWGVILFGKKNVRQAYTANHIRKGSTFLNQNWSKNMSEKKHLNKTVECGIIMPISQFGTYTEEFWSKIRKILDDAISLANMKPVPVWEDSKNDIIHAKIIKNISSLPVVIGVIVGGNPNVMLECGMRLWSNLPILLINGEDEKIPFDVGSISCLPFPKDFDYFSILKLKEQIVEKLKSFLIPDYKTFKSYYSVPAEVEAPKDGDKIDFNQFVGEMRGEIRLVREELRNYQQMQDNFLLRLQRYNMPYARRVQMGDMYPYYQRSAAVGDGHTVTTRNGLSGQSPTEAGN